MTAWASGHPTLAVSLCVLAFLAACTGICLLGYRTLHRDGKHAGNGTSRDEETAELFAAMARPAGVAHDPLPEETLAAPVAAAPEASRDMPPWAVQDGDGEPLAPWPTCRHGWLGKDCGEAHPYITEPAEISHDEDGPDQAYDGHAEWSGGILLPRLAIALAAVTRMRRLTAAAIVADAHAQPFKRWESDTFVGGIPVVRDEHGLAKPAFDAEKAGEAS